MNGIKQIEKVEEVTVFLSKIALEAAMNGKVTEELKVLYKMPYRAYVHWYDYPLWSQPNLNEDGVGHEG